MPELKLPSHALSGPLLLITLLGGVAFIVVATTRFKLHPFLALLVTAYAMGLCSGLDTAQTVAALTGGVGQTVGHIGIVIACGSIIGVVLEKSGCAMVMAGTMVRWIGEKRSALAMACTGALVSIPVFCDSGYVILSPLARSLARKTGQSLAVFSVALSMGLYATHCLVPPTPGPLAAAGQLRADMGTVILLGLLVAAPIVTVTYFYAQFIGRRILIDPVPPGPSSVDAPLPLEEFESAHRRPNALAAFAPIFLPILLIALESIAALPAKPLGEGVLRTMVGLVGNAETALVLGVFLTWWVVRDHGREAFGNWCGEGLRDAGTIVLIVAAGGALGAVLRQTSMTNLVGEGLAELDLGRFNILLPFLVAAGLKVAIGSSTMSMITTASLVSHLLPAMGLAEGFGPALATLAVGCGAMVASHVNDAYFWVITQMSGMSLSQGYRLITVASIIAGFTGIVTVVLLSMILFEFSLIMKLKSLFRKILVVAILATSLQAAPEAGRYLRTQDFDATTVIPVAPTDDSLATRADLETVYQVQLRRTPEQIAIANYFAEDSVFQYDAVIGLWFTAENLPRTAEFFQQVDADRFAISSKGKQVWKRPRPPLLDARIHACAPLPASGSYPSGHSTQAFLTAGLLAEVFPEHRVALFERAELVAWSRVVAGVHYPTDIAAGRILGERLVGEFLKVPAVREALAAVRTEAASLHRAAELQSTP